MSARVGAQHYGAEWQASGKVNAERLGSEDLGQSQWKGKPSGRVTADRIKVALVSPLKRIRPRNLNGSADAYRRTFDTLTQICDI
jgi:hypothetical protein